MASTPDTADATGAELAPFATGPPELVRAHSYPEVATGYDRNERESKPANRNDSAAWADSPTGLALAALASHQAQVTQTLRFLEDDLVSDEIVDLLDLHLREMHAWSPPCSVHAMPVERLRADDVTFWSAWDGERLAGCGALRHLDDGHGEVKSMRTHADYRGKGAGRAILLHLMEQGRARGYARLSLETGSSDHFAAPRGLYAAHGFEECGPFSDYQPDPFSYFMTRTL